MNKLQNPEPDEFIYQVPSWEGKGYEREIKVHPNLSLCITDIEFHHDLLRKITEWEHPVQFKVTLSGKSLDKYGGQVGEGYTLISGSGVQRTRLVATPKGQYTSVDIEMTPNLLRTFFPTEDGDISPQLKFLIKGNDWQTLIYPEITTAIQGVAQQIVNCPYQGMIKRMYLQAKIQELMALQLAPILAQSDGLQPYPRLKAQTIVRIHHARDILLSRLENPPLIPELAQLVGVSDRTFGNGFRELFGTTVFGYLTSKRMEQAEQLLRSGKLTVTQVANLVGYAQQGHFAIALQTEGGYQKIRQLSDLETSITSAQQLLVQLPIPQTFPPYQGGKQGGIVQITGVKANPTEKGVEVILQTTQGEKLQLINRSAGNNFITDIPNTQLSLPSGEGFTFRSEKPLTGIIQITVTNIDSNTVQVTVVGEKALPTVELFDDNAGLVFAVASAGTATQPPQQPQTPEDQQKPVSETPPEEPTAQQDKPIELVVTREQDTYNVPDSSTATKFNKL